MARQRGTDRSGNQFSESQKREVWRKGQVAPGFSPDVRRLDKCGATIDWAQYGNANSTTGWEIDHIRPVAKGGGDEISNLQPLQWENNRHKGDEFPYFTCFRRG
jgi:5-methylcytosine-specific restriction endonuclease McrA